MRWLIALVSLLVILPGALALIVATPAVQTRLVNWISATMLKDYGIKMDVGKVRLTYFLDAVVEDVDVYDGNRRLLASVSSVKADVRRVYRKQRRIEILRLSVAGPKLDVRVLQGDSVSNLERVIQLIRQHNPPDTLATEPWTIGLDELALRDMLLIYDDMNHPVAASGFDPRHIRVRGLDADISLLRSDSTGISLLVESLVAEERAGMRIEHFSSGIGLYGNVLVLDSLHIQTPGSHISMQGKVTLNEAREGEDAIDAIVANMAFSPSVLDMRDIIYFSPDLAGLENTLRFSGKVRGKLGNLKARDFSIDYGYGTRFRGDITLNGLPDIKETFVNLSVEEFRTTLAELSGFRIPGPTRSIGELDIPDELQRLGSISMSGNLTGFYYDFVSYASFRTGLGSFSTDISIREGESLAGILYDGSLNIRAFDIGELIGDDEYIGQLSARATLKGKGIGIDADVVVDGVIDSLRLLDYSYDRVAVNGHYADRNFDGSLNVKDPDVNFDFIGLIDWSGEVPVFDFEADIHDTHLAALNILEREGDPVISTRVEADFTGTDPDSIIGEIRLSELHYRTSRRSFRSEFIDLSTYRESDGGRIMELGSDLGEARLSGMFGLDDIAPMAMAIAARALPTLFDDSIPEVPPGRTLTFEGSFHDTDSLLALFVSDLEIPRGLTLRGEIKADGSSQLNLNTDRVSYMGNTADTVMLSSTGSTAGLGFYLNAGAFVVSDSLRMRSPRLDGLLGSDSLRFELAWDDPGIGTPNQADLKGFLAFSNYPEIHAFVDDSWFRLNDSLWHVQQQEVVRIDTNAFHITQLKLVSRAMSFSASGSVSPDPNSVLRLDFKEYNVSDLDFIANKYNVDFDGIVNGRLELRNVYKELNLLGDIRITDLGFNGDDLGDAEIISTWDRSREAVRIDAGVITKGNIGQKKTLSVGGIIHPSARKDQFDLVLDFENFRVHTLQNFLSSFSSDIQGLATGRLFLQGNSREPELTGALNVFKGRMKIDYLNTVYTFSDVVRLGKDYIEFDSLLVNDNNGPQGLGNTAVLDGRIYHDHFRSWKLDFGISTKKITMLNTARSINEYYYGRAVGSGNIGITGTVDDIDIQINARTEAGTVFAIPLIYPENVRANDFIRFVGPGTASLQDTVERQLDLSGIRMGFDLEVTPDAEVQLIFDEKIGDVIKGNGSGDLSMQIDTRGQFEMFGELEIDKGEYLFTLQNVINKRFRILPGGTINWTGDPYNAQIDLEAAYTVQTSMYSLGLDLDTSRRRVPVLCKLHLTGNLMQPDIDRSIEFPGMNTFEAEQYKAAIQPNLNYQFLSLLVMNSFIYAGGNRPGIGTFSGADLVGTNSYEFVSNQISNWLSKISNDFDIGVNYRPEDELSNEQLQVILSTQLFNDRLTIDGNIDVGGNQTAGSIQGAQNTSNIVGDVNLEYKITPEGKFRIKAFNRSNYRDPINSTAPYTQGMGVFYRKEFDSFKDLFRKKEKIR